MTADRGRATGRTGGRPSPAAGATERTTHRGVEWRKDPDGTLGWYNEGLEGWVRWRPDGDHPPLPPGWEDDAARIAPSRARRPAFLTPWRLVPLALIVIVVVIGLLQAFGASSDPVAKAEAQARALAGRCLAVSSGTGPTTSYRGAPVACSSPSAAVRVDAVRPVAEGCPAGTAALQLSYYGVRPPLLECVTPARRR